MIWLNLMEQALLWWLCYSCIGWIWETSLNLVTKHRWVDRGALNGPLCPIYGNGALLVILLLRDVTNPFALFLASGVIACTLEYVVSWMYEALFHLRLWDYSDKPFNINGRVYLNGFLAFGAGATLVKMVVQPQLAAWTALIPQPWLHALSVILLATITADSVISTLGISSLNTRLARLGAEIKAERLERYDEANRDLARANTRLESDAERARIRIKEAQIRIDEITERRIRDTLSRQQLRLMRAFPNLTSRKNNDLLHAIHDLIDKR